MKLFLFSNWMANPFSSLVDNTSLECSTDGAAHRQMVSFAEDIPRGFFTLAKDELEEVLCEALRGVFIMLVSVQSTEPAQIIVKVLSHIVSLRPAHSVTQTST